MPPAVRLTDGFQAGFAVLAGAAVVGALIAAAMLRPHPAGAEVESLASVSTAHVEEAA